MSDVVDRFLDKVDMSAGPDGCWPWEGAIHAEGYGMFRVSGGSSPDVVVYAHRFAFELFTGEPAPVEPMTIDHAVCGLKICMNARHYEVVTRSENGRRARAFQIGCGPGEPGPRRDGPEDPPRVMVSAGGRRGE